MLWCPCHALLYESILAKPYGATGRGVLALALVLVLILVVLVLVVTVLT